MEKNNERVLAYTLATPISSTDLDEVSGGGGARTAEQTFQLTGNSASGMDTKYDYRW